uniref:Transmembrane protein 135 n=1 Tax=Lygus hesperus TaxID=30085 RepID=A0A0A9YU09_LYGHE
MVAVSRLLFDQTVNGRTCQFFVHPDEPRCSVAILKLVGTALKGSAKYFFLMYVAQNVIKYKTLSKDDIRPIGFSYIRSIVFGVWALCSTVGVICLCRNLRGKLDRDIVAYAAGATGGCGVYFDDPRRRPVVSYTLSALAVEALFRRLYKKVKRRIPLETIGFMILNAILMYKMRASDVAAYKRDVWFYRPPRIKKNKKVEETVDSETGETLLNACPHAENGSTAKQCYDNVMKETTRYYIGGMLFSAAKLLFTKPKLRRHPLSFLRALFQWSNMRLACFFGWYIGVYKTISCCLCRWTKQDKAEYALLAGFFSGLSYGINTNLTILGSLVLYVSRILGREVQEKYQLPRFHFMELSAILGLMTLINTRIFDPDSCPGGFRTMVDGLSEMKLECLFSRFMSEVEKQRRTTS